MKIKASPKSLVTQMLIGQTHHQMGDPLLARGNMITWRSKMQNKIPISNAEAENRTMAKSTSEIA